MLRLTAQCGRLIQHLHGVFPHIALRMVLRRLQNADQRFRFREPDGKLVHLPQLFKKTRRPCRFQQRLLQFSHDAFPGQMCSIHF